MLSEKDNYAIGWAQRYCVEGQPADVVKEYVTWFKKNVQKKISKNQAEHLYWDLTYNYIPSQARLALTYPDCKIPDEVYELVDILSNITNESKRVCKVKDIFPLVRWSAKYCMRRHTYASDFVHDIVTTYLNILTPENIQVIANDIKEYDNFCQSNKTVSPVFLGRCPEEQWITFLNYLNPETHKVAIDIEGGEHNVFYDDMSEKYRVTESYLKNPWVLQYLPTVNIKKFKN